MKIPSPQRRRLAEAFDQLACQAPEPDRGPRLYMTNVLEEADLQAANFVWRAAEQRTRDSRMVFDFASEVWREVYAEAAQILRERST